VTLSAALLGAALASGSDAPASAVLVGAAIRPALSVAAGQPTAALGRAVLLMEGVLRDMVLSRIKKGLLVVLALVVVGAGVGLLATRPATAEPGNRRREDAARQPSTPAEAKDAAKAGPQRPIGLWERTVTIGDQMVQITLRVEPNRVTATHTRAEGGNKMTMVLEGEYSITRDYVLYGIITSVDVSLVGAKPNDADDIHCMAVKLVDHPFSVRYRVDENALTVKDVKFGPPRINENDNAGKEWQNLMLLFRGRYKKGTPAKDEAPW
jgi:hypothetical protein